MFKSGDAMTKVDEVSAIIKLYNHDKQNLLGAVGMSNTLRDKLLDDLVVKYKKSFEELLDRLYSDEQEPISKLTEIIKKQMANPTAEEILIYADQSKKLYPVIKDFNHSIELIEQLLESEFSISEEEPILEDVSEKLINNKRELENSLPDFEETPFIDVTLDTPRKKAIIELYKEIAKDIKPLTIPKDDINRAYIHYLAYAEAVSAYCKDRDVVEMKIDGNSYDTSSTTLVNSIDGLKEKINLFVSGDGTVYDVTKRMATIVKEAVDNYPTGGYISVEDVLYGLDQILSNPESVSEFQKRIKQD